MEDKQQRIRDLENQVAELLREREEANKKASRKEQESPIIVSATAVTVDDEEPTVDVEAPSSTLKDSRLAKLLTEVEQVREELERRREEEEQKRQRERSRQQEEQRRQQAEEEKQREKKQQENVISCGILSLMILIIGAIMLAISNSEDCWGTGCRNNTDD